MNTSNKVVYILFVFLILFCNTAQANDLNSPKQGNFIPSDLNVKTHPFVGSLQYGGIYHRGRLSHDRADTFIIKFDNTQKRIPESSINIPLQDYRQSTNVLVKKTQNGIFLVTNSDRINQYLVVIGISLGLTLLVGGWITLRSLLGVFLGLNYLLFIAIPGIQSGDSILLHIGLFYGIVCLTVLPASLGWRKESISAVVSAISAGGLSGTLIYFLVHSWQVIGLRNETFQLLEFGNRYFPEQIARIDLPSLIIGTSLIGALGVILDVSVDVTSSASEISRKRTDLPLNELMKRTMNVSKRLIGTMTNTLLLAYIGTDIFLLLTVYLLPSSKMTLFNKDFIAIESIRALGGVIGFLGTVPLSIMIYRFICNPESTDKPPPPAE